LILMPATPELVSNGGHAVMYWLRRTALFPAAALDRTGTPLADPDEARGVCALLAAVSSGSAMVIPRRACADEPACRGMDLIATDRNWLLGRRTAFRVSCPSG
jgi:hypothetical protein